jgi:hypothetical protein
VSKDHFYVFVAHRGGDDRPEYHIVPTIAAEKRINTSHRHWLREPGRGGRKNIDSPMRIGPLFKPRQLESNLPEGSIAPRASSAEG